MAQSGEGRTRELPSPLMQLFSLSVRSLTLFARLMRRSRCQTQEGHVPAVACRPIRLTQRHTAFLMSSDVSEESGTLGNEIYGYRARTLELVCALTADWCKRTRPVAFPASEVVDAVRFSLCNLHVLSVRNKDTCLNYSFLISKCLVLVVTNELRAECDFQSRSWFWLHICGRLWASDTCGASETAAVWVTEWCDYTQEKDLALK